MLVWFAGALFASAALIFTVEPLIGRLLLPRFGGTSVVWNTCLVFFQLGLLVGYGYAYLLTERVPLKAQIFVHLGLVAAAFFVLPVVFPEGAPQEGGVAVGWLLGALALNAGLPFALLSASAPLFQSWFARTDHPDAADPYHLYAASNAGSLLALLAYPLLVEPTLALDTQGWVWTGGYAVFFGLVARIAHLAWRRKGAGTVEADTRLQDQAPELRDWGRWLGWSALPSALLVSVTDYVTTDVAAVPLLWVVPLALYLLSFIVTFARTQIVPRQVFVALVPAALVPTAVVLLLDFAPESLAILLGPHLVAFFIVATVYHGELVAKRPSGRHSSAFYLAMAAGGVVGGAFSAFLAPLVFDSVAEYPLLLCAAVLVLPRLVDRSRSVKKAALVAGVISLALGFVILQEVHSEHLVLTTGMTLMAVLALALWAAWRHPRAFGVLFSVLLVAALVAESIYGRALVRERSYFGHYRVTEKLTDDERLFILYHGSTIHGFQSAEADRRLLPMGYYAPHSGVGKLLAQMGERALGDAYLGDVYLGSNPDVQQPATVGVVGLGIGGLAAYAVDRPLEFTFFEIDPVVVDLARDERYFDYLARCGQQCQVQTGDGRIRLRDWEGPGFDLLVLDAYDSDSIPVHLLTREAVESYLERLNDGGVLAFHVTNRYFDLPPVVGRLCEELSLQCVEYTHTFSSEAMPDGRSHSTWVFAGRDSELIEWLADRQQAKAPGADGPLWTDDFANIWGALE
ncbi:MAG: spermidine synthase [Persicimonas sp.]